MLGVNLFSGYVGYLIWGTEATEGIIPLFIVTFVADAFLGTQYYNHSSAYSALEVIGRALKNGKERECYFYNGDIIALSETLQSVNDLVERQTKK